MTNTAELECCMIRAKINKRTFAKLLGISPQTLHNKLYKGTEFKASEIMKTCDILNLTVNQTEKIFFTNNVE